MVKPKQTRHKQALEKMFTSTDNTDEIFEISKFVNKHYNGRQAQAVESSLEAFNDKQGKEIIHQKNVADHMGYIRKSNGQYERLTTRGILRSGFYVNLISALKFIQGFAQRKLLRATEGLAETSHFNAKELMKQSKNNQYIGVDDVSKPGMDMYLKAPITADKNSPKPELGFIENYSLNKKN